MDGIPASLAAASGVNGRPVTIVGVVATRYTLPPTRTAIWLPLMQMPTIDRQDRTSRSMSLLGHLTDGSTLNETQLELRAFASRLRDEYPDAYTNIEAIAIPFHDRLIHPQVQQIFLVVFGAGLVVLFIACANVANLLLARAANRQQEIATRVALGASRGQIAGQVLIESLLLGTVSGGVALALLYGAIRVFDAAIGATNPPVWPRFDVDWNVFLFVTAVSVVSSLGTALLPVAHAARQDPQVGLQPGRGTVAQSRQARRWSATLVAVEVALTLVLLVGAGLMMRAFWSLFSIETGIGTRGVTVFRLDLGGPQYQAAAVRRRAP